MSNEATNDKATTETAPPSCAPSNCYAAIVADLEIIMQKINSLRQHLNAPQDNEMEDELWLASMKVDRAMTIAKRAQRNDQAQAPEK